MRRLRGFPPVGAESPRILVLGSFPSAASLERGEYYGHERNHFWALLGRILGFDPGLPYAERIARLESAGIALWDLVASCEREGSLDQAIRYESLNPLAEYIGARASIERIALNGGKAASSFLRRVATGLGKASDARIGAPIAWKPAFAPGRKIIVSRLPSSSPVPTRDYRGVLDKLPAWTAFFGSAIGE